MSWLFSRALVEEFSAATCSGGEPCAPSSETLTPQAYLSPGRTTEFSRPSQCGMTFAPLTDDLGAELLAWFLEDSLVRTLALPAKARASKGSEADSGPSSLASFAKWSQAESTWKTPQLSLLGDSETFCGTWPRWGLMLDGECWELDTLARPTCGNGSGFWPTPTATDFKSESMSLAMIQKREAASNRGVRLTEYLLRKMMPTPNAGNDHWGGRLDEWGGSTNPFSGSEIGRLRLNPSWVEELMGWPVGWTDLKPLETAKFRLWQQQHGNT